jgi:hypothetical protein
VSTVMNLRVPYNVGKFLSSCASGGFSRRVQLHGSQLCDPSNMPISMEQHSFLVGFTAYGL